MQKNMIKITLNLLKVLKYFGNLLTPYYLVWIPIKVWIYNLSLLTSFEWANLHVPNMIFARLQNTEDELFDRRLTPV